MDLILVAILGLVAWCVASEGSWGAALTCLSVILAGLLAMNFFEPLAEFLARSMPAWRDRWDIICLVGLFTAFVFGLRMATDYISPTFIQIQGTFYEVSRWFCGLLTGYVTMAFLLTAIHTAPLPRTFIGFAPERLNLFGIVAPDRQWLGFTQYVSEHALRGNHIFDGPVIVFGETRNEFGNDDVWPSFPIRYATRRERFAAGGTAARSRSGGMKRRGSSGPKKTKGETGGF